MRKEWRNDDQRGVVELAMTSDPPRVRVRQARRVSWRSSARSASGVTEALARLGARVRALRMLGELSQEQAAKRARLDPAHWRSIEAGQTNPTLATLVGIARAMNVEIGDLFS